MEGSLALSANPTAWLFAEPTANWQTALGCALVTNALIWLETNKGMRSWWLEWIQWAETLLNLILRCTPRSPKRTEPLFASTIPWTMEFHGTTSNVSIRAKLQPINGQIFRPSWSFLTISQRIKPFISESDHCRPRNLCSWTTLKWWESSKRKRITLFC